MHTLHFLSVIADDQDSAFSEVLDYLQPEEGWQTWYDWFVIGGGRWSFPEEDNIPASSVNQYTHSAETIISMETHPETFLKYIELCENSILTEVEKIRDNSGKMISAFEKAIRDFSTTSHADFDLWEMKSAMKILSKTWCPDVNFFDVTNQTSDMRFIKESMFDKDVKDSLFLVPVDFHF